MNAYEFGLAALAAKRLTRLAVDDAILDPIRDKIWAKYPPHEHGPGYVLTCHSCSSIYAAALACVLPRPLRVTLALSECVLLVRQALREQ